MRSDDGYTVDDVVRSPRASDISTSIPAPNTTTATPDTCCSASIVQRVTGKIAARSSPTEQIFTPLGMTISHFHDDHNEPVQGGRSRTARCPSGGWTINVWNNDIVGQGGLMTTIEDLAEVG